MKFNRIMSIILMVFLMNGCSWYTYLGIRNDSSAPINIKYTLKRSIKDIFKPNIVNNSDLSGIHNNINNISFADYKIDNNNMEITAIVNPKQTLIIEKELNFHGYDPNMLLFPITSITIITPKGTIIYSDNEVLNAFKEVKRTVWVIQYK